MLGWRKILLMRDRENNKFYKKVHSQAIRIILSSKWDIVVDKISPILFKVIELTANATCYNELPNCDIEFYLKQIQERIRKIK